MFDDTLSEALAVQLRQSPFLNLLPEQQVQMTLRQMGREPMEPLTPEIAREVCQRATAKAMLGGTIASIGNSYLLTLGAQDCVSGDVLAEEQAQRCAARTTSSPRSARGLDASAKSSASRSPRCSATTRTSSRRRPSRSKRSRRTARG